MEESDLNVSDESNKQYNTVSGGFCQRHAMNSESSAIDEVDIRRTASLPEGFLRNRKEKATVFKWKRKYKRLVFKSGETNISNCSIKQRKMSYLVDIFTTMIDIKWRYAIVLFVATFVCSWLLGGLFYWLTAFAREDTKKSPNDGNLCINQVTGFMSALLFSIETQHTIGYGFRAPTEKCPETVLFVMLQSWFGVIIQALMTGYVFMKLTRPDKRAHTLMFSKEAVICQRDGQFVLLIRVGDMRKSIFMEPQIRGLLIKKRITEELEILPLEQYEVDFGREDGTDRLFIPYPVIIEHKINEDSPFWELSEKDMANEQFELIVALTGIAETSGNTTQAKTSYLPSEIQWGYRFQRLITYQKGNGEYRIDYGKFHTLKKIANFPRCSARMLSQMNENNVQFDDNSSLASTNISGYNTPQIAFEDDTRRSSTSVLVHEF